MWGGHKKAKTRSESFSVEKVLPDVLSYLKKNLCGQVNESVLVDRIRQKFRCLSSEALSIIDALVQGEWGYRREIDPQVCVSEWLGSDYVIVPPNALTKEAHVQAENKTLWAIADDESVRVEVQCFFPGDRVLLRQRDGSQWDAVTVIESAPKKEWPARCGERSGKDGFVALVGRVEVPIRIFDTTPINRKTRRMTVRLSKWDSKRFCYIAEIVNASEQIDPVQEMLSSASRVSLPIAFAEATLLEAQALADEVAPEDLVDRVDLRDIPFATIDGEDARDFDDAVYATPLDEGGWRLLVAIADVSHYVTPSSALDSDAQVRATSVYFPSQVIPMLPEKLSNGLCSLNPNVDRLVMVCDAIVSSEGEVRAYQFYPAVIHSHARLTYTLVWQGWEKRNWQEYHSDAPDLSALCDLYRALRKAREIRHALDIATQESQVVFDEEGLISGFVVRAHNDAHCLIEECMLVANTCAADFSIRKKVPTLFRVHEEPAPDRVNELSLLLGHAAEGKPGSAQWFCNVLKAPPEPYVQEAVLRTMSRACYSPENIGHFGLQYDAYAHFTSPIRRYPDLLLHRTIKGILAKKTYVPTLSSELMLYGEGMSNAKMQLDMVSEVAAKRKAQDTQIAIPAVWRVLGTVCSAAERRADDATRDVMAYLKAEFMSKRVGETFPARIVNVIGAGLFVRLLDMPIDGFVHVSNIGWDYYYFDEEHRRLEGEDSGEVLEPGVLVNVSLMDVELEMRRINFRRVADSPLRRRAKKKVKGYR